MKLFLPALAASVMLLAISCKHNIETEARKVQPIQLEQNEPFTDTVGEQNHLSIGRGADKDWDKKIIKTAVINVETEEYKNYHRQIQELVTKWESYISREEESENDERINNSLTIKVPVSHFDDAVSAISGLKGKMLVKQISSEDVTGQIIDVRSRTEAKKRVRLRYLDMLQKAKNIEEIIQVEREVNQIQEEIEASQGRLNYLTHTASYSTIELSFFQVLHPGAAADPNPGYGKKLLLALNEGLKWMGNLLIFFATLWPLWLILAIGLIIIKRMRLTNVRAKD